MNFKTFDKSNDVLTTFLDTPNNLITISNTAGASSSGVWAMVLNSTTAGFVGKPDTSGTASNISTSAAFKHIANYFYGTGTYVLDANNGSTQNTTIRVIQFAKPNLSEGLYQGSISAVINSNNSTLSLTAVDLVDTNSQGSALGLTGQLVNVALSTDVWGSIFYDHGVMVFSHSQGTTGGVLGNTLSGFSFGAAAAGLIKIPKLDYQTRAILKRTIYFCRGYNKEYNYTFNPTARGADGRVIGSLSANPATWITTVGLYNDNDELLAVAKISPAKKKSFNNEVNFRVQLDF